jgi:hypothetical protein
MQVNPWRVPPCAELGLWAVGLGLAVLDATGPAVEAGTGTPGPVRQDPGPPCTLQTVGLYGPSSGRGLGCGGILLLVFERFTESARQVVVEAQAEARELRYGHIDTEHVLLGLLADRDTGASRVLKSFGVTAKRVRKQVLQIVEPGETPVEGFMPFTPATKRVLELSFMASLSFGSKNITPEHLLLGVVDEREGVATQVLLTLGAERIAIRNALMAFIPPPRPPGPPIPPAAQPQPAIVSSNPLIRRLLAAAGGRAVSDGRTQFGISDLLASMADDGEAASALASLGVDVQAMGEAIERESFPEEPAS